MKKVPFTRSQRNEIFVEEVKLKLERTVFQRRIALNLITGNLTSKVPLNRTTSRWPTFVRRSSNDIAIPQPKCRKWTVKRQKPKYERMATIETLNFDNLALRALPIDAEEDNFVRQVSGACFSRVKPTPVEKPETVAYAAQAMQVLN